MSRIDTAPALPKGSKEVQLAYLRHRTICRIFDGVWVTARTLIKACAWVAVGYFLFAASKEFAGKETKLSAVFDAAVKTSIDRYIAYLGCAIFGVTWQRERRLRRRVIADHAEYIKGLELKIDPDRTGSGLLPSGKPRKRDTR